MITRIPFVLDFTIRELRTILLLKPFQGKWKRGHPSVVEFKAKVRTKLKEVQTTCAYCGLLFKGEKDMQIDHIAPKAESRQPQFTFTPHNLVFSCVYCNQLNVKGFKPTVKEPANKCYKRCEFLIVHPYFDDPDQHYQWNDDDKILIQEKDDSLKGKNSIEMFGLDSEYMSSWRAAEAMIRKKENEMPLIPVVEESIQNVLNYKID